MPGTGIKLKRHTNQQVLDEGDHQCGEPDQETGGKPGEQAVAVCPAPVEPKHQARQELDSRDECNKSEAHQVLLITQHLVHQVGRNDDCSDQHAACVQQPQVDVDALFWPVEWQQRVVQRHAGQCQR